MTNDATIEKIHELMEQNPRGLSILRDELIGLLVNWDREDRKDDRFFHLSAWNGYGGYICDRIGRGTIDTPQLCEVIFGGCQPSKLLSYLALTRNNIENDGLLQRFQLFVFPDEPAGVPVIVDQYPNHDARIGLSASLKPSRKWTSSSVARKPTTSVKIPYFHFTSDAQQFFNGWLLSLETKLHGDDDAVMIEHLAKYRSLMPSLALVSKTYLIEAADQIDLPGQQEEILLHSVQQAAGWCDYLETHARRIYGLATNMAVQSARRLLEKIKAGVITDGFNARDVYRQDWAFSIRRNSSSRHSMSWSRRDG